MVTDIGRRHPGTACVSYDPAIRLLLIFITAMVATAQSAIDPIEFRDKKILRLVDVNRIWRTLGISEKVRRTTAHGAVNTSRSFDCSPDDRCEAEYAGSPDWPLLDGEEAVVRISPAYLNDNLSRFLVFHRNGDKPWRLVDYLDSTEWNYDFPKVSVANSAGKRWLVVMSHPHCGTGCSLSYTDWYELKNGKLRMVLTLPLSGGEFNANPSRQFETRFVRGSRAAGRETLDFIFQVEFTPSFRSSSETDLWGEEKLVRFYRSTGQAEFRFDAKNSEASEIFLKEIFSTTDLWPARLFELIQDRLMEIARGTDGRRRAWLNELLEKNPNLPELARVRAAFFKGMNGTKKN